MSENISQSVPATSPGFLAKGALLVLGLASLASLSTVFNAGMADVKQMAARATLLRWQANPAVPPKFAEIGPVQNGFIDALGFTPRDPQLLEQLGLVFGKRAELYQAFPEAQALMLDEAIERYRQALTRRPMSAYAWANLALALGMRGREPERMWEAYDRALRYGAREYPIQRLIAEVGFSHWQSASETRRAQLLEMIQHAYPTNRDGLVKIAERYKLADVLPAAASASQGN